MSNTTPRTLPTPRTLLGRFPSAKNRPVSLFLAGIFMGLF